MKVLLCHPQTQHSHKVAKALFNHGLLYKFSNTLVISNSPPGISKLLPSTLKNRIIDIPSSYLHSDLSTEVRRFLEKRVLKRNREETYFKMNEMFQQNIPNQFINTSDVIIGFDSSSWILASRAKKQKKIFLLDRTIAHHSSAKSIYEEGRSKYSDWSREFDMPISDRFIELENNELKIADYITVGGSFAKRTLLEQGVPEEKVFINPYGINMKTFYPVPKPVDYPIKFLFFGTIGARKGIPSLLAAWKKLAPRKAVLQLAGYGQLPSNVRLPNNVELLGEIHPSKRNELFNSVHVLVFPSLFEGFGQVLTEASACGLPLISTFNTGAVELVEDGVNGFLIKANDHDSLAERIDFFIRNIDKIEKMGHSRLAMIREDFSLEAYERRWLSFISLARKGH